MKGKQSIMWAKSMQNMIQHEKLTEHTAREKVDVQLQKKKRKKTWHITKQKYDVLCKQNGVYLGR